MDIIELCEQHIRERDNPGAAHYPGCEQSHLVCAMKELLELTRHLVQQITESDRQLDQAREQHAQEIEALAKELRGREE